MKTCTKCKIEKLKSEFNKDAQKRDGLTSCCKACNAAGSAAYHSSSREKISARQARYRSAIREELAAKDAIYYAENRHQVMARQAKYRAENRENIATKAAKQRALNPEVFAERRRNRRAMERNAEGSHKAADVRAIFDKQRGLCASCETKLFKSGKQKYHVDHMLPLALGGSNWPSNLQCLCPDCNLRKSAKDPIKWANENGRLL